MMIILGRLKLEKVNQNSVKDNDHLLETDAVLTPNYGECHSVFVVQSAILVNKKSD